MPFVKLAVVLCLSLVLAQKAVAQKAHTPALGTEERAALMDALRIPAERDLKQPVVFKVDRLLVAGDWAFARVFPLKPDSSEIDFTKTKFRPQIELGAFDPQGEALLRRDASRWKIVEWVFGSTDVPSAAWPAKHSAPKSLFE